MSLEWEIHAHFALMWSAREMVPADLFRDPDQELRWDQEGGSVREAKQTSMSVG